MVNLTFYVCRDTSESEEEEDQLEKENSAAGICQTLTDIASGYTVATITGDFFGDSELAGLGVEGLVSLEGGVGGSLGSGGGGTQQMLQEWTLPCEAFEQKQEIKDDKEDDDLLVDSEAGAGEAPMQTVTVEDKTSSMVVWGAHAQVHSTNHSKNRMFRLFHYFQINANKSY